jgi:hypothetical protein
MPQISYWELDKLKVISIIQNQELKRWWVAECAGVHKTTLRRWLNGKITLVQRAHLESLANVLNVSGEEIAVPHRVISHS